MRFSHQLLLFCVAAACASATRIPPAHDGPRAGAENEGRREVFPGPEICVVIGTRVVRVTTVVDPSRGDTLVNGRPLRTLFTPGTSPYAGDSEWYRTNKPIEFARDLYFKNSAPLSLPLDSLQFRGAYRGVPVFIDQGSPVERPVILYALITPDCTFQAYYVTRDYRPAGE
jgi:hypothetical protein